MAPYILDKLREINSDGYAIVSAILNSDDIYKESKIWRNKLSKNKVVITTLFFIIQNYFL